MNLERQVLDMQSRNNDKHTILVSGASGIVGYGILKSLKDADCRLIGTTIYEQSPADCFADIVETAPLTCEEGYIPWLKDMICKYQADMIIPAIEADMSAWNKHRLELEQTGTKVLLNRYELVELCLDKWKFYERLREEECRCRIETSITPDSRRFELPFILKPRCGFGSRGVVKITSEPDYEQYREDVGRKLMMQEYVGSEKEEYTVSAFFDADSEMRAHIAMRRKLSKEGYTETAEVIELEDVLEIIQQLAEMFRPVGPTNFQFRNHNGEWKLLEINPRISSSTSIRTAFGYNEAKMCVDYFLDGQEIRQPAVRRGKAIRYIEDYIIYDSDNI